jgi:hypothetical protein
VAAAFDAVFAALKPVLATSAGRLAVQTDTRREYTVVTKAASPFPQHKGHPLPFGSVRVGKAYVSFHLMPVYMHTGLLKTVSPALKKRMQGKACFNFKTAPEPELLSDLRRVVDAALGEWDRNKWL